MPFWGGGWEEMPQRNRRLFFSPSPYGSRRCFSRRCDPLEGREVTKSRLLAGFLVHFDDCRLTVAGGKPTVQALRGLQGGRGTFKNILPQDLGFSERRLSGLMALQGNQ